MTRTFGGAPLILCMALVCQTGYPGHIGINVLAGGASMTLSRQAPIAFLPTAFRTDTVYIDNQRANFSPAVGLLYRLNADSLHAPLGQYLSDLSLGLNWYYTNSTRTGSVYEYSLPNFNNATYDMPIKTSRLMLDMEWGFHPVAFNLMPFVEAGLGGARNTMGFTNIPRSGIGADGGTYQLPPNANTAFAYELGLGLKYACNDKMLVSLRYLYSDLSHIKSSLFDLVSGVRLGAPIQSSLHAHGAYLGLSYFLDKKQ